MCITVSSSVWEIRYLKTVQTFWPFRSEHSHFRHVTSFTNKNVCPASTTWSHSISNKPCMHECRWINGSEEQICHWSSWDEALPWRMGLCLWETVGFQGVHVVIMPGRQMLIHPFCQVGERWAENLLNSSLHSELVEGEAVGEEVDVHCSSLFDSASSPTPLLPSSQGVER